MVAVGLKDVAALAGVSIKTVSNVINDYPHITQATRERVQTAIDELGYRPNQFGRSLRTGRTGVIALAVPAIDNPYYATLARLVIGAAAEHGWTVLVDQTDGDPERERLILDGIRGRMIDGLLFAPRSAEAPGFLEVEPELPVVLLGDRVDDPRYDRVTVDSRAVARTATEHLRELGRNRLAAIGCSATDPLAIARTEGFRDAGGGAEVVVRLWDLEHGASAAADLLAAGEVDGIVCFNDALAIGAMHALLVAGKRVPEDVAVIGVDDVPTAAFLSPPLSSILLDKAGIARAAVELLADRMKEPGRAARVVEAGFELVVRGSSG